MRLKNRPLGAIAARLNQNKRPQVYKIKTRVIVGDGVLVGLDWRPTWPTGASSQWQHLLESFLGAMVSSP